MVNEFEQSDIFENLYQPKKEVKSKDGYVMLGDLKVVNYIGGKVKILDRYLAPLYISRTKDVEGWVCSRSIDTHRTNSRLLRKAIRLSSTDEFDIAMSTYCATITDRYWFKPLDSNLTYSDVKFTSDKLSSIALDGKFLDNDKIEYQSPEFTNTGSFEKCWRLINGEWVLIKKATPLEKFSELFVYRLGHYLKLNVARYLLDDYREDVILSEDFTEDGKWIFEPMESLIGDCEDYIENVRVIQSISKSLLRANKDELIEEYLNILFMDTICMNVDRHTQNYGFLRDSTDGKIESMAPNFDNNLSLVSRGINEKVIHSPNRMISEFIEVVKEFDWYTIPKLDEFDLKGIIVECNEDCGTDVPIDYLVKFIMNTYNIIIRNIEDESNHHLNNDSYY